MSNNYVLPKVCRVTIEKSILRSVTIIEQVKMQGLLSPTITLD